MPKVREEAGENASFILKDDHDPKKWRNTLLTKLIGYRPQMQTDSCVHVVSLLTRIYRSKLSQSPLIIFSQVRHLAGFLTKIIRQPCLKNLNLCHEFISSTVRQLPSISRRGGCGLRWAQPGFQPTQRKVLCIYIQSEVKAKQRQKALYFGSI